MFNSRYPQLSLRAPLAETVMRRRSLVAQSVMAYGLGEVLCGFVVLVGDPGKGSGM